MSLESLLTKVDESIWKQYEKVTNWAYNNYGWSKYDLATMCKRAEGICLIGVGTYLTMDGLYYSPINRVEIVTGALFSIGGMAVLNSAPKDYKTLEQLEMKLAIRGAAIKSHFGALRPLCLLLYASIGSIMAVGSYIVPPPEQYAGTIEEYRTFGMAIGFLFGLHGLCSISSIYFRSQLPKPPQAKKSIWQALYESITKRLRKAVPLPEPKPGAANS